MEYLIGIDIGTTNSKLRLYNRQGVVREEKIFPTPFYPDQYGGTYEPEEIADLVVTALKAIDSSLKSSVVGLSVSSFAEVLVGLGKEGRPALRSLAFFDKRTSEQYSRLADRLPPAEVYRNTGLSPYHIYSLYKLRWHREAELENFQAVAIWTSMAGYLLNFLGGELSFDYSLASRTMLFDQRKQAWDPGLLELAGAREKQMAPLVPSGQILGSLREGIAWQTGLPASMKLVAGGHDHLCAALAAGVIREGQVLVSTGTTESLTVALEALPFIEYTSLKRPFSLGHHVLSSRFYAMHGIYSGGYAIDWGVRLLGEEYSVFNALSLPVTGGNLPLFFPYLLGADYAGAKGAFLNLAGRTGRNELLQGLVTGLCFEYRNLWEEVIGTLGIPVNRVINVGGASRNRYWMQLKSSLLGYELIVPRDKEGSAKGAALLAGLGCGVYRDAEEAFRESFQEEEIYAPLPAVRDALESWYDLYRDLWEDIQRINRKISVHRVENGNRYLSRKEG
ncbi:MAG TPA: FGGY-family carbohydrate kinase [Atribacteraceae bacterium]|nr:FGGY-family carbohydrate kinase [Atribacteraceae bacterium]